jgi:sortase A
MPKINKKLLGNFLIVLSLILFIGWLLFVPATNVSYYISQKELKEKWQKKTVLMKRNSTPQLKKGEILARLKIKKISLDTIVLEGASTENLRKGPSHLEETPLPGEKGNCVISGHRITYGAPFRKLDQLKTGDLIEIASLNGEKYVYQIYRVYSTLPTDPKVLASTKSAELTLTTCDPPHSARKRLIVKARLLPQK